MRRSHWLPEKGWRHEGPLLLWGEQDGRAKPTVRAPRGGPWGKERLVRLRREKARGLDSVMGVGESAWELH